MQIAPMSANDLLNIVALEQQAFRNPWGLLSFQGELACGQGYNYVLKTDQKQLIAYLCVRLIINELHILKIAVRDEYQRKGIASHFFNQCLKEIPQAFDFAFLEVRPSNIAAIRLYEKIGFIVMGIRPDYYLDTDEDAIIMGKIFKGGSNERKDSY